MAQKQTSKRTIKHYSNMQLANRAAQLFHLVFDHGREVLAPDGNPVLYKLGPKDLPRCMVTDFGPLKLIGNLGPLWFEISWQEERVGLIYFPDTEMSIKRGPWIEYMNTILHDLSTRFGEKIRDKLPWMQTTGIFLHLLRVNVFGDDGKHGGLLLEMISVSMATRVIGSLLVGQNSMQRTQR